MRRVDGFDPGLRTHDDSALDQGRIRRAKLERAPGREYRVATGEEAPMPKCMTRALALLVLLSPAALAQARDTPQRSRDEAPNMPPAQETIPERIRQIDPDTTGTIPGAPSRDRNLRMRRPASRILIG
ncbi:hypothetical protein Mnod_3800 [Methylobacterium nodulans ORS 2060]|uniref:Uncharacterized protein n=1 Tax=Methylobacterium nodulans (strain LMG 21967 / CNCM I-2342 / ORS 2060) TaxID=460265 RepID=B8IRG4_METNO|nr:hypothetical protein Mnod_3800 [Methylobacterium nodulans ORS 2060]